MPKVTVTNTRPAVNRVSAYTTPPPHWQRTDKPTAGANKIMPPNYLADIRVLEAQLEEKD